MESLYLHLRNNFMFYTGFTLTIVWLSLIFFGYLKSDFNKIACLSPNEFGDFLAGVFAPLAFLWLVIAVLIQQNEFSLQREELKEAREVQKEQGDALSLQANVMLQQAAINEVKEIQRRLSAKLIAVLEVLGKAQNINELWVNYKNGNIYSFVDAIGNIPIASRIQSINQSNNEEVKSREISAHEGYIDTYDEELSKLQKLNEAYYQEFESSKFKQLKNKLAEIVAGIQAPNGD